jgi:hypothetical protein
MTNQPSLPMRPDWELKVERAEHHLEELNTALNSYQKGDLFELKEERRPGEWIWTLSRNSPPPIELSLIVGDVVHNLRSALDCRVVAIAEHLATRQLTEDEERQLGFVAFNNQKDFEKHAKRWEKLLPEVAEGLIKCLSVFQLCSMPSKYWTDPGSMGADDASAREFHIAIFTRLTRLSWLSNRDKHRRLHTVLLAPSRSFHSGFPETAYYEWTPRVLNSGDIVTKLLFDEAAVLNNPIARPELVQVLENAVREGDFSLYDELQNIAGYVKDALTILRYEEERLHDEE